MIFLLMFQFLSLEKKFFHFKLVDIIHEGKTDGQTDNNYQSRLC